MIHIKFKLGDQEEMPLRKKLKISIGKEAEKKEESRKDYGANWRDNFDGMAGRNRYALQHSILTDVIFEVGTESTAFPAHKLMLALSSPVFEAMFFGPLAEKGERIVIPDIMPDGFKALLEYIYTEYVGFGSETLAFQTWFAADKYCVPQLKQECELYLGACMLTSTNVWQLLENSIFFNISGLITRCQDYLTHNTQTALESSTFLTAGEDTLKNFLKLDRLNVLEINLSKSIILWGKAQVSNQQCESLQVALSPLLGYIRFDIFSQTDFCTFLDLAPGVMDDADALGIMKYLVSPLTYTLPSWCSCQGRHRNGESSSGERKYTKRKIITRPKQEFPGISFSEMTQSTSERLRVWEDIVLNRYPTNHDQRAAPSNDDDNNSSSDSSSSSSSSSSASSSDSSSPSSASEGYSSPNSWRDALLRL